MNSRLFIAFTVIAPACVFAYPYAHHTLMRFDRTTQRAFDTLPMGIKLEEAKNRLGSDSIREADHCCLPQRLGFEPEFDRAEKSAASRFYLFRNGVNWYYCLGFDANGHLVVTGQGCS